MVRPHVGLVGEAGPEAIIPLSKTGGMGGLGATITVNSSPVINLGAGAGPGDLSRVLSDHAQQIADEVRRIIRH